MEKQKDFIDIAEYLQAGKTIPRGRRYRIRIQRKTYIVTKECLTGRELLELAGKAPPERFQLYQHFRFDRKEVVELDEKVDLATCGVEKFTWIPLGVTEGRPKRQDFQMPKADQDFLGQARFSFDTLKEGNYQWLIIREYPIPEGFNVNKADIALLIPSAYPSAQIDMAYFFPALQRTDRRPIHKTTSQVIERKSYQRWSRHRTGQNQWQPGEDDVSTHLAYMEYWLTAELKK